MTSRFAAVHLRAGPEPGRDSTRSSHRAQISARRRRQGLQARNEDRARAHAGPKQILVRVRAVSLNQRDLLVTRAQYGGTGGGSMAGKVPLSDGAGEVVAVGAGATRFRVGDRVAGIFFARWIDGNRTADTLASARGGAGMDGMLSEFVAGDENGFVRIPDHLSYEEASTLPCAGVTAYRALFVEGRLKKDEFVLLEGTGGVSTFGLQFAAAAGARPIITSSSDDKIARVKAMGAFGTVNYRTNPEWQKEVRKLTGDAGVSHVLEVGGRDTLPRALEALAYDGHIALIGGLSGFASDVPAGRPARHGRSRDRHLRRLARGLRSDEPLHVPAHDPSDHRSRVPVRAVAAGLRADGQRQLSRQDRHQAVSRPFRGGGALIAAGAVLAAVTFSSSTASHAAAPGDELPDGAGKKVLLRACTTCHDLDEVTKFKGYYTRAQWKDIVVTMKEYGAGVDDGEVEPLANTCSRRWEEGVARLSGSRLRAQPEARTAEVYQADELRCGRRFTTIGCRASTCMRPTSLKDRARTT
jgi:NADPH:quinone reductase-like Zn-dependent oxidoreductase